jgi:hypothetical protein
LKKEEVKILREPEVYRKRGERVEDALYRDYQKRSARQKLMVEAVRSEDLTIFRSNSWKSRGR